MLVPEVDSWDSFLNKLGLQTKRLSLHNSHTGESGGVSSRSRVDITGVGQLWRP